MTGYMQMHRLCGLRGPFPSREPSPRLISDVCQEEKTHKYLGQNKQRQYLQLQLLYDLHLHPTLGRAPVIQGVLIVKMPAKQTHKELMSVGTFDFWQTFRCGKQQKTRGLMAPRLCPLRLCPLRLCPLRLCPNAQRRRGISHRASASNICRSGRCCFLTYESDWLYFMAVLSSRQEGRLKISRSDSSAALCSGARMPNASLLGSGRLFLCVFSFNCVIKRIQMEAGPNAEDNRTRRWDLSANLNYGSNYAWLFYTGDNVPFFLLV